MIKTTITEARTIKTQSWINKDAVQELLVRMKCHTVFPIIFIKPSRLPAIMRQEYKQENYTILQIRKNCLSLLTRWIISLLTELACFPVSSPSHASLQSRQGWLFHHHLSPPRRTTCTFKRDSFIIASTGNIIRQPLLYHSWRSWLNNCLFNLYTCLFKHNFFLLFL